MFFFSFHTQYQFCQLSLGKGEGRIEGDGEGPGEGIFRATRDLESELHGTLLISVDISNNPRLKWGCSWLPEQARQESYRLWWLDTSTRQQKWIKFDSMAQGQCFECNILLYQRIMLSQPGFQGVLCQFGKKSDADAGWRTRPHRTIF